MTCHLSVRRSTRALLATFALAGLSLTTLPVEVATRADPVITATWRGADIAIDGSMGEWPRLDRVGSGPGVAVQNDATHLNIVVATNDPTVRLQLATGLVLWIDGSARKAQTFGIRLEGLTRRPLPGGTPDGTANSLPDQQVFRNVLDEFDRLGPARNQRRLVEDPEKLGMAFASGVEDGTVIYELRLPLTASGGAPHAVGAAPGATISMGLETPTDPKAPRQRGQLDDPMNTYPLIYDPYYFFFNPPPPSSSGSRAPKEIVIKPMKLIWAQVRLAPAP